MQMAEPIAGSSAEVPVARNPNDGRRASGHADAVGLTGAGVPLPESERAFFEPRFGQDLSHVRLHDNAAAAPEVGARAFALGRDIAFAPGEYAPGTAAGRALLAHELAHVVRQPGGPPRIMRKVHPGCDRKTTGLDDADARIDTAHREAIGMMADARAAFPHMSGRTIRVTDRHVHCPGPREILALMDGLARIEKEMPKLDARCVSEKTPRCKSLIRAVLSNDVLELCPPTDEFTPSLPGTFVWGAALMAGFDNSCLFCENDFTLTAPEMLKHASTFRRFVDELTGHGTAWPVATIPCRPFATGTYVSVPPGPAVNPRDIRPVTGHETPAPGSTVRTVYKDASNKEFIYADALLGAETYLPNEPKRYYLTPGRFGAP
jgi:hypothetical protein